MPQPTIERRHRARNMILYWTVEALIAAALIASFPAYVELVSPTKNEEPVCAGQLAEGHEPTTVKEVAGGTKDPDAAVSMYGQLDYSLASDEFYVREGIHNVRLDVSDCEKLEPFQRGRIPAFVKGKVAYADGEPYVRVDGMAEDVPIIVRHALAMGFYGAIALAAGVLIAIFFLIGWFLRLIGILKPKLPKPITDEMLQKQAGSSVLLGMSAPLWWYINPFFGIYMSGVGIYSGIKGLRSKKRKAAFAGILLCAAGMVIWPAVMVISGAYEKVIGPDVARNTTESFSHPEM